jgi:hypothetical protein
MIDLEEKQLVAVDPATITPSLAIEAISNEKTFMTLKDDIKVIEEESSKLVEVKNQATEEEASVLRSKILDSEKNLKKRLDFFQSPAKDWIKKVGNLFKPYQDKIKTIDDAIEEKQKTYRRKLEAEKQKIDEDNRKKLEEALKKNKAPPPMQEVKVETTTRTESGGTSYKKEWFFEIQKPEDVPLEYCTVDESKIRQAVKSGIRKIKGVRIFEDFATKRR